MVWVSAMRRSKRRINGAPAVQAARALSMRASSGEPFGLRVAAAAEKPIRHFTSLLHTARRSARAPYPSGMPPSLGRAVPASPRRPPRRLSPRSDLELRVDHSVGRRLVDAALALLQPELRPRHHDELGVVDHACSGGCGVRYGVTDGRCSCRRERAYRRRWCRPCRGTPAPRRRPSS